MTTQTYTLFMLLKTTREWLDLEPKVRFAFIKENVNPILEAHPTVSMRFFDTESYNARISDIVVWKTSDLVAYQGVIKGLRDTIFWDYYFEVLEIIPAMEDGYAAYYAMTQLTGSAQAG